MKTTTPDRHPNIIAWVHTHVPPPAHKVMLLIANVAFSPWWSFLYDTSEQDQSETTRGFAYAQNVMLPAEPLWHSGGEFTRGTPDQPQPPLRVPALVNVVAPALMMNTHKLMCREFTDCSETNQRILESSVADPLIHALHAILGGVALTAAIDDLLTVISELDKA